MAEGFSGINEFLADLKKLSTDLQAEAGREITATAQAMEVELRSRYNRVSGNLIKGVVQKRISALRIRVLSRAPHAHLVEYGTVIRRHKSGKSVGAMDTNRPIFVPAAVRKRSRMMQAFTEMLRRAKVRDMKGSAA